MRLFALKLIACTAILVSAGAVFSHGDEAHAAKTGPVKMEQKDWGIAGTAKAVKRTIAISMSDAMRFTPNHIDIKRGETVKFTVKNDGTVVHEFVIGTTQENEEHAAMMVKFPNMKHAEPYMLHVAPSKSGEMIWTFNKTGQFDFACLIAGHYQAGMRGTITVSAK